MEKIKVELEIELDKDVVEDEESSGKDEEDILGEVESHIKDALGNRSIGGWQYISSVDVVSIGVA